MQEKNDLPQRGQEEKKMLNCFQVPLFARAKSSFWTERAASSC
jgi:hypothetical protein